VIESVDWTHERPRVLVFEAFHVRRDNLLRDAGYHKALWDGINTFWVREEDVAELGQLLSYPASTVLDQYDPWHYVLQILQAQQRSRSKLWRRLVR
jgi:hypothetical protein